MTEQKYQKSLISALEGRGHYVVKVVSASKKGVPDILACVNGYFLGIEVKKPGRLRTLTALQEYNLRLIKRAKGASIVASTIFDLLDILQELESR